MAKTNWKQLFTVGFVILIIMLGVNMLIGIVVSPLANIARTAGQILLFIISVPILGYVAIWAVKKFKK